MKTTSIILNSIGIVLYFAYMFTGNAFGIVIGITGMIVSIMSIITMCNAKRKGGWYIFCGILDLLFGLLIAGIFMLCVSERSLEK